MTLYPKLLWLQQLISIYYFHLVSISKLILLSSNLIYSSLANGEDFKWFTLNESCSFKPVFMFTKHAWPDFFLNLVWVTWIYTYLQITIAAILYYLNALKWLGIECTLLGWFIQHRWIKMIWTLYKLLDFSYNNVCIHNNFSLT